MNDVDYDILQKDIERFVKEVPLEFAIQLEQILHNKGQFVGPTKKLNSNLRKHLGVISEKLFIRLYNSAAKYGLNKNGFCLLIIFAIKNRYAIIDKQTNIMFSFTQDRILSKKDSKDISHNTQKSLIKIIEEAKEEIIIFGYDITYPDNPAIKNLKKKIGDGFVKLKLMSDKQFLPKFIDIWKPKSFDNVSAYIPKFHHEKQLMHAKLILIDRKKAFITSANMTFNGMRRNIEIGVVLDGRQVNELYLVIDNLFKSEKTELIDFYDYF